MRRRWKYMPPEVRREIIRLGAKGHNPCQIVTMVDVSESGARAVLQPLGGVIRREMWEPGPGRLSSEDRVEIRLGLERGESLRAIAKALSRSPSTVSREVVRNGGRAGYRPLAAHRAAQDRAHRPKATKLATRPELCVAVKAGLERLWSPEQIAAHLREDFGHDPSMQVSHETIYKSLYVQGRGELRRELARCLRTGRAQRRPRGRLERGARIADMVMISERPAEVDDRAVPGHWEGDLLLGKDGRSAIGTLVERATRYVLLLHLPNGRTAEEVRTRMTEAIKALPQSLWRTLTWDQGTEMAQHVRFRVETGVDVYFCDPHSPWQRGSNENTNGLLRQYFPKGTDLSRYTVEDLQAAADSLNGRPRKTMGWKTPAKKLAEVLVASTG